MTELKKLLDNYVSAKDARKMLGVTRQRVDALRLSGKLHPSYVGGVWWYSKDEIKARIKLLTKRNKRV